VLPGEKVLDSDPTNQLRFRLPGRTLPKWTEAIRRRIADLKSKGRADSGKADRTGMKSAGNDPGSRAAGSSPSSDALPLTQRPLPSDVRRELSTLTEAAQASADDSHLAAEVRCQQMLIANRLLRLQQELDAAGSPAEATNNARRPSTTLSLTLIITGGAIAIVFGLLRTWGVAAGVLYGNRPTQYITGICVAGFLLVVAGVVAIRSDRQPGFAEAVSKGLGLVAALVSTIALLGIFLPAVQGGSDDFACPGTRTRGVGFVAAAAEPISGVNARTKPRLSAAQVARYPTGCLVGFDGFCIGDPVVDVTYAGEPVPRRDGRWLRIARHRNNPFAHWLAHVISGEPDHEQYIAAGVTQARSLVDLERFRVSCAGERPSPTSAFLTLNTNNDGTIGLTGNSEFGYDIQYAIYVAERTTGEGSQYRQITAEQNQRGLWRPEVTGRTLTTSRSAVVIVAVPCVAPGIRPSNVDIIATQAVTMKRDGTVTQTPGAAPAFKLAEAADVACQAIE
jgi:hypothetical protein